MDTPHLDILVNGAPIVLKAAATELAALKRGAGRWIPVSERLPDSDGEYIIYNRIEGVKASQFGVIGKRWFTKTGWDNDTENDYATHWQPLPAAPIQPPSGEGT